MANVPPFYEFVHPLLLILSEQPQPLRAREAYDQVADRVGLTPEQRGMMLPSGTQPTYRNRIGWAQDFTKRLGLTVSPFRGGWTLTDVGKAWAEKHRDGVPEEVIAEMVRAGRRARGRREPKKPTLPEPPSGKSPDERIEDAAQELRESLTATLLERIGEGSPEFFEMLVLDLLHAMDYGVDRESLARVGGSGDGGIDGVISLDRLGLEKIYVQAKRWKGNVGRPDIQAFYGALAGKRANKGVFITTSDYTREAREFHETVRDRLVLVEGEQLAGLMIDHQVGVSHSIIRLGRLDGDYFEDA